MRILSLCLVTAAFLFVADDARAEHRLPPEVVSRIVRQNKGRFELCYAKGLETKPTLRGDVKVKFAIDRTGAVTTSQDAGSTLPDRDVVACVVRAFQSLSFPQPEGGGTVYVMPLTFSPKA